MIKPPESAPLPWRRTYTLGMTSLVDANGEPVISADDEGGLIVDPDVWDFLLAAVNIATDPNHDARNCLDLIRVAIEQTCPAGVLPSSEMVNGLYGPLPIHEAEALAKAIILTVEKYQADLDQRPPQSASI